MPRAPARILSGVAFGAEAFAYESASTLSRLRHRADVAATTDLAPLVDRPPTGQVVLVRPERRPPPPLLPSTLEIVAGSPGHWVGEGHYVPRTPREDKTFGSLYGRSGELIPASILRRGRDFAPEVVARPQLPDHFEIRADPVIFGGRLVPHFGHFLTEAVARLWYALDVRPDLPILVEGPRRATRVAEQYLSALGISEHRIVSPTVPTRFTEVHVPEPTWIARALVHDRHLELGRAVARTVLNDDVPSPLDQPLYLARTHLAADHRATYGERSIVQQLTRHGARVVHPQELDFTEQVRLVNAHRTIVGPVGSAHHLSLFALKPRHHVYLCHEPKPNFVMSDHALGNRAHHLACARPVRSAREGSTMLDVSFALAQLRELGLVGRTPR